MDTAHPYDPHQHRPGPVSTFFVVKAALFAAGFWAWLAVLALRGLPVSGWHIVAATGAATTTLVGVVLGVRQAMDRAAADRYQALHRTLVEASWYAFSAAPNGPAVPAVPPQAQPSGAEVIPMSPETRPRRSR